MRRLMLASQGFALHPWHRVWPRPRHKGFAFSGRLIMAATATTVCSSSSRIRPRTALLASADGSFRQKLGALLSGLRWNVREACGGAQAWGETMDAQPQVIVVDSWLPDLD